MTDAEVRPDRRRLAAGAVVAGTFGVLWTNWGASGVAGAASAVLRILGVVVGLAILVGSARLWRSTPRARRMESSSAPLGEGSRSQFSLPSYLLVVAIEVVALGGGGRLLDATGHGDYVIAWVAVVVGLHFLALGRCSGPGSTGWGRP